MQRVILIFLLLPILGLFAEPPGHDIDQSIKQFVGKYCYNCHDEDVQKGSVRLDDVPSFIKNNGTAQVWQDVLDVLNTGDMPPEKAKKKPSKEELGHVIGKLTEDLLKARKILTDQGGEVVVRRLNKLEYINSIESLTGINLPARLVPDDENAEDFNTMGANQYFSPSHIERYMELGELAASKILIDGAAKKHKKKQYVRKLGDHIKKQLRKSIDKRTAKYEKALLVMNEGHDYKKYGFKDKQEAKHAVQNQNGITTLQKHYLEHESVKKSGFLLMQRAHHKESISMPADFRGKYILKMKVAAEEGMLENDKHLEITQNDELVGYYYIHGTLEKPQTIEIEVRPEIDVRKLDLLIKQKENNRLPNTHYQTRLTRRINKGEFIPSLWVDDLALEGPFYDDTYNKRRDELLGGVDLKEATESQIKSIFVKFAQKAFRGKAATADYISHLYRVYQQELAFGKSNLESLVKPFAVILTSPEFLFLGEEREGDKRATITGRDMATRLSYVLWKEAPSDKLLFYGDDLLNNRDILSNQIDEMINDPRFKVFVEEYFGQWLHIQKFDHLAFSKKLFPNFDQGLILSARQEIFEFIHTVIKEDLPLTNLVDSDFTVVNGMIADYYKLPGITGYTFRKVKLVGEHRQRGGLLGKVAIQAMGSTGERTSPVERGAFILRKFLNSPPPPPPPNVPQLDIKERKLSISEKLQKHNEIAQCNSCHKKMDPLGLAMENFDAIGRWVDLSKKKQKQLAGTMPDGTKFTDFVSMKQELLKNQDKMVESMIEGLIKYGLGREQEFSDQDFIEELLLEAKKNDYRFKPLLKAFLTSKQFTQK